MPESSQPSNLQEGDSSSGRKSGASQPEKSEFVQSGMDLSRNSSQLQGGTFAFNGHAPQSWFMRRGFAGLYVSLVVVVIISLGWAAQRAAKMLVSAMKVASKNHIVPTSPISPNSTQQANAERLLERLARGDLSAVEQVVAQSPNWTGKTRRTQKADQFLEAAINSNDMRIREASLHAFLALDGVPQNETGRAMLERAVGNPNQRAWALWLLGTLGHLGVDPVHSAKIIESYLDDPDIGVRSGAVNGLELLATDETIPMLLDRFRNDPSPVVQERAICGLAQSGMFTHAQRMVAAKSLVGWLDDSLLTVQQRTWAIQALQDIAGASLGSDPVAWRKWWSKNSHT